MVGKRGCDYMHTPLDWVEIISVGICCAIMFCLVGWVRSLWRSTIPWREHVAAEKRAQLLLRDVLRPDQYAQVQRDRYLEIESGRYPQRTYRIPLTGGLVKVLDRGCEIKELCLQPIESLPHGDIVLIHKLLIETSEEEYLSQANHFTPGLISMRY